MPSSPSTLAVLTREELAGLLEEAAARGAARALASRGTGGDVLSTEEAASIAGVSAKTIREWIAEGLPAGHRGRRRTVRRADLDAWRAGEPPKAAALLSTLTRTGT